MDTEVYKFRLDKWRKLIYEERVKIENCNA